MEVSGRVVGIVFGGGGGDFGAGVGVCVGGVDDGGDGVLLVTVVVLGLRAGGVLLVSLWCW